jgi:hypothetical protein
MLTMAAPGQIREWRKFYERIRELAFFDLPASATFGSSPATRLHANAWQFVLEAMS